MCDRFVDSLWVVLRSAQSVVEHLSHFRYLSPRFGKFRGTTQSELTQALLTQLEHAHEINMLGPRISRGKPLVII